MKQLGPGAKGSRHPWRAGQEATQSRAQGCQSAGHVRSQEVGELRPWSLGRLWTGCPCPAIQQPVLGGQGVSGSLSRPQGQEGRWAAPTHGDFGAQTASPQVPSNRHSQPPASPGPQPQIRQQPAWWGWGRLPKSHLRSHGTLPSRPRGRPGLLSGTHFRATLPLSCWAQHGDRPPRALCTLAPAPPSWQPHSPGWASRFTSGCRVPRQGCRDHTLPRRCQPRTAPAPHTVGSLSAYCTEENLNSQSCRPLDQQTGWPRPARTMGETRPSYARPSPPEQPGASVPGSRRQAAGQGEASPASRARGTLPVPVLREEGSCGHPHFGGLHGQPTLGRGGVGILQGVVCFYEVRFVPSEKQFFQRNMRCPQTQGHIQASHLEGPPHVQVPCSTPTFHTRRPEREGILMAAGRAGRASQVALV